MFSRWPPSRGPLRLLALLCTALVLAACGGSAPAPAPGPVGSQAGHPATSQPGGGQPAASSPAPKLRIAMILPGTVEDADYNFVGFQALEKLKLEFGADTRYQERVAPADAERVARGFINDGFNVVAFHGGQFVTTVQKLAPAFPDVNFIMESSGEMPGLPANVWNIGRKFYQGFYALGSLGGLATKSGKIGVIAGVKLPDFVAAINAIQRAVREANPSAKVLHTFVGDQNDPVKARQAAAAMMNENVDFIIIIVNLGAHGIIEAVKDKPVLITTYYTDKTAMAPKNFAGSLLLDFAVPYTNVIKQIRAGKRSGYEEQRPGNGMSLSPLTNVPDDVARKVQGIFTQIVNKQLNIPENIKDVEPQ